MRRSLFWIALCALLVLPAVAQHAPDRPFDVDEIQRLLDAGADLSAEDDKGRSPRMPVKEYDIDALRVLFE